MLNHKASVNDRIIIQFFILALMSGITGLPPRRSEYSLVKIRNFNKEHDNYYDKGKFTFNVYKTAPVYGRVVIDVKKLAPQLDKLLKKWIKINKTDYLLYSANHKPLSSSQLAQHNAVIWEDTDKKISCDLTAKVSTPSIPETGKPEKKGRLKRLSGSPVSGVRGFEQMHF